MLMPGIVSGMMALEMTVDERAPALHMDPLELRLLNRAEQDKYKNLSWSSKGLRGCCNAPVGSIFGGWGLYGCGDRI